MLNKIKSWLKKYKRPILIVSLLTVFYILIAPGSPIYELPVFNTATPDGEIVPSDPVVQDPVVTTRSTFTLVSRLPENGDRATIDQFEELRFDFSAPIDSSSVVIETLPPIELKPTIYPESPNVLFLKPISVPWRDRVAYSVTISARDIEGNELSRPVTHLYRNTVPNVDFSIVY